MTMSEDVISGTGRYRKDKTVTIRTSATKTVKLKFYVKATFNLKSNGKIDVSNVRGGFKSIPAGVRITNRKPSPDGTNPAYFKFYAQSNYSRKKQYSVTLTAHKSGNSLIVK